MEDKVYSDSDGDFSLSFSAEAGYSYWITGESDDEEAIKREDSFFVTAMDGDNSGDHLHFAVAGATVALAEEEDTASFTLSYLDGEYALSSQAASALSQGMDAVSIAAGERSAQSLPPQEAMAFLFWLSFIAVLCRRPMRAVSYEEDALGAFGFEPVVMSSYLPGEDGDFSFSLPTANLSGQYFLRFWLYRAGTPAVAYYYPVEIRSGYQLFGLVPKTVLLGEEAKIS